MLPVVTTTRRPLADGWTWPPEDTASGGIPVTFVIENVLDITVGFDARTLQPAVPESTQ
jgi:hypothetical protein